MIVCPQCSGSGKTTIDNEQLNVPGGITFTDKTQVAEIVCNYCLGSKFFNGSST